jgi:ankyrin
MRSTRLKEDDEYSSMVLEGYAGNVDSVAQGGYTPLMFAARVGDIATARLLINRGADINAAAVEDGTPLVIASAWGHEELAMMLVDEGADPNIPDANGMTALHYAMRDGLKLLHGYEIVAATRICGFAGDSRCKPLDTATDEDREALNDPASGLYIVEGELDSNDYDGQTRTVLPGGNMYDLAESLLAHGADVNAEMKYPPGRLRLDSLPWLNLEGATPFFLATASLDNSAMEMLLEHGANPLVRTNVNDDVFLKQTKAYADDNQILGNGTPLMVAVGLGKKNDFTPEEEKKALETAKRLIALGADVNDATATGWTALHAAAFVGANSLIKFLVENGANVNVQTGCGRTPLSLAEGLSVVGLLDRTIPRESTVEILKSLGAGKGPISEPAGQCVLGRGGLEVDIEFTKEFLAIKEQQKQQQEQEQQKKEQQQEQQQQ